MKKQDTTSGILTNDFKHALTEKLFYLKEHSALCKVLLSNHVDGNFKEKLLGLSFVQNEISMAVWQGEAAEQRYIREFVIHGSYQVIVLWIESGFVEPPEDIANIIFSIAKRNISM